MAIKDSYPAIRPSLDLNFAGSRMVDPRITFTRANTGNIASYFNEKGVMQFAPANTPRIDFDPATLECKGLLIEEQRTNLLTYSEQFDNAAWTKRGTAFVTANTIVAPDGSLTADLIEGIVSGSTGDVFRTLVTTPSQALSASIYINKVTTTGIIRLENAHTRSNGQYNIDLSLIPPGWQRITAQHPAVTVVAAFTSDAVGNTGFHLRTEGTTALSLYAWGAQLEAGAFPTSYIKTEASQVTRAADNASMLGENFSSWYRQDEGTFVVGWRRNYTFTGAEGGGAPRVFTINDDALTTLLNLYGNTSGGVSEVFGGSGTAANLFLTSTVVPANTPTTFACAYKENDCAMVRDGGGSAIDTSYVPATSFTRLYLGNRQSIDRHLNGHISRLAYYPRRLANEQLQALTA